MPNHELAASIVIPTRNRADKLARAVDALATQRGISPPDFEVLVGIDGHDPLTRDRVTHLQSAHPHMQLHEVECARSGIAAVKNRLIEQARGRLLILLNDDVLPAPDFIARHLAAHAEAASDAPAAVRMVLGDSPFLLPAPDEATFFDQLAARTSLIFFYDQMPGARLAVHQARSVGSAEGSMDTAELTTAFRLPPEMSIDEDRNRDWGFRHAWNLNLSVPRRAVREVGGFRPAIANCCFEDVELAYRISRQFNAPVLFRPEAVALHDHRMTPEAYLQREYRLGYTAWGFARAAPECAATTFGVDLTSRDSLDYAAKYVAIEGRREPAWRELFQSWAEWPADTRLTSERDPAALSIEQRDHPAAADARLLRLAYEQHLPLKRLVFRQGLLDAAEGREVEGLYHPDLHPHLSPEPGLRCSGWED